MTKIGQFLTELFKNQGGPVFWSTLCTARCGTLVEKACI